MFCITVISPSAYSNQQYGWPTTYIPIKDATSSQYTQVVKNSINAWNNAVPGVKIHLDKNAPNTIYSGNYKNNWIGYYSYYTRKGKTYKFNIYLNNRLLSKRSYNYKQSTLVHELGHALSLADNPSAKSIMRHDRNRNVLIAPTADDKAGVKKHYKLK
jgi:predicted Zn-dependent protease